ncbi:abscission/NoCut checkpoint regulator isoform X1 [Drosophila persimilis]|uniref:abscission/NoCut checkpoint regulator isoform X1 n=1 Tax=Drosophila persimilis TaxID=7234 RepID=UPI000F09614D|nr:abscission/NoCut checkpoint regulator isoform X1 [Drosophila persimilis]
MSCFGCSRKYGLFSKEYGCPNCGFSYCSKCLKRPIPVPRFAGKVLNVCLICYDKLSKIQTCIDHEKVIDCDALPGELVTKLRLPHPLNSSTRLELEKADVLFNSVLPSEELAAVLAPIRTAGDSTKEDIEENLDSAIAKRLQNLKDVDATDDEIRTRLANISGLTDQKNYYKKDLLLSTDQRSDQEKIKDLLDQFMDETQLDQKVETQRNDAISDIERRLCALRNAPLDNEAGTGAKLSKTLNTPSENEDEEMILRNVIKKYVAESSLLTGQSNLNDGVEGELAKNSITEELPWCNICNEDAVFRCRGCDGELFCSQCYREYHDDDEEYRAHVKLEYSSPPKFTENHF